MTAASGKRLRRADELTERHMGRVVTVGDVSGILAATMPCADGVVLVLIVGGARAVFPLDRDAVVEVVRAEASA